MNEALPPANNGQRFRWRRLTLLLVCMLVGGELAARLWDLAAGKTGSLYDYVITTKSRFKMQPATAVNVPERYGTIRYSFNREGYRDRDHSDTSGRRSIVLLGDSVTFGLGVRQDAIYAAVLQRQLDARLGPRYDVVNLAVFAYDSGNELAALREDGLSYHPSMVVVQFYMNDLAQPPTRASHSANATAPPPPTFWQRLTAAKNVYLHRSALYRRLQQGFGGVGYLLFHNIRRQRFAETLNDAEPRDKLALFHAHPDDATIPALASLLAMRDTAVANGASFVLFVSPDETQLFTKRFDGIDERLALFCERNQVHLVDTLTLLRSVPNPETLYLDGVHLSARGHDLVGRRLTAELVAMAPSGT